MPQIYQGFGIDVMSFYRGADAIKAKHSEYIWEGPDGSRLIATRLGQRPRHNVWYIILRRVYWNPEGVMDRRLSWNRGRAPFRFVDGQFRELDFRYAHPEFGYYGDGIAEFAAQAIAEQDEDWSGANRFWSAGHDWSWPDIREVDAIADCDRALGDKADVFHSSIREFHDAVRASVRDDWPVLRGEMRHSQSARSPAILAGWILSGRTYIKQDNFRTERALTGYAEPLAVFASLLGASYPQGFIDRAYRYLLENHGHDSVGGCSRDIVHDDMLYRSRQCREVSTCVMEQAMSDVAGAIDLSGWAPEEMALVVYNPTPQTRTEVLETAIDIPEQWDCESYEVQDLDGRALRCQRLETIQPHLKLVQVPQDAPNFAHGSRHVARIEFPDVPPMGYRTFRVAPVEEAGFEDPKTLRTGPMSMANEFIDVTINANGTLDVTDRKTGRSYPGLGYFRDEGEIGSPWQHTPPANDGVFTTLAERARVRLIRDGELETAFEVALDWALPARRTPDETARSADLVAYRVTNTVTLRRGQPWVEVVTEVDNAAEDHILQVCFPTGLAAKSVDARGQFDVLSRPFEKPDYALYVEPYQTEEPMNSFVDISDGEAGLALLNEGLKAYESEPDAARTVRLTLLRCYAMRIFENDYSHEDSGCQCPGRQVFRYAVMPHAGDWAAGGVWQAAERFNLKLLACQIGPSDCGSQPTDRSFLELKPESLHVSAIKRSENGKGWVVRLFNPLARTVRGRLRLNGGRTGPTRSPSPVEREQAANALPKPQGRKWRKVRLVSLEEEPQEKLAMDAEGWVALSIPKKKILTVEFVG